MSSFKYFLPVSSVLLVVFSLATSGCYYDVEEDLYPDINCDTTVVTYSGQIVPILSNNCLGCHSNAANNGNVSLEGHQNVLTYVQNGKLLGSVRHDAGFSPMPKNQGSLVQCDIAKIEKWVANGSPND